MSAVEWSRGLIYVFSCLGLWLLPRPLGKLRWAFVIWFAAENLFLFLGVRDISVLGAPLLFYVAATQLPWALGAAWFIAARQKGLLQPQVSAWVACSVFRLMNLQVLFHAGSGLLPGAFLAELVVIEGLVGLAALILPRWLEGRSRPAVFFLLLWNMIGFLSAWNFERAAITGFLNASGRGPDADLNLFYSHFPEVWIPSFWIPLALLVHLVLFYELSLMLLGRAAPPSRRSR